LVCVYCGPNYRAAKGGPNYRAAKGEPHYTHVHNIYHNHLWLT
jgi:hypothetical protein